MLLTWRNRTTISFSCSSVRSFPRHSVIACDMVRCSAARQWMRRDLVARSAVETVDVDEGNTVVVRELVVDIAEVDEDIPVVRELELASGDGFEET